MMNNLPAAAFLHELAAVERAQESSLVMGVTLSDEEAKVECAPGAVATIPLTADRSLIARLLAPHVTPLADPAASDPRSYPDSPDAQEIWCELLDDLGAYLPDLSHADVALRLVGLRRQGALARIRVTNGIRSIWHDMVLDSGETPAAVPIDIAHAFAEAEPADD